MTGIIVERVETLRVRYVADQNLAGLVDQIPDDGGSRLILKELLRDYMAVLRRPVEANDALDLFHTIIPFVFCDWVLLDGPRVAQLNRIAERLRAAGRSIRMPEILSNKRASGGVKRLVDELTNALQRSSKNLRRPAFSSAFSSCG